MSPDRWRRLHDVVDAALGQPMEAREGWLADACGGDDDLAAQARRLLAGAETADGFLRPPDNASVRRTFAEIAAGEPIGRRIGSYELTHVLGAGGMGTVYGAIRADDSFERQVAIKLINRGMDSVAVVRRFERERRLLARLDHPNIARLLDGGTTEDGRPYIVMEHVAGVPIDQYCRGARLDIGRRLELFVKVCTAVHYAHQNLIVHRDLKPSNILVGDDGEPKLLDFGISKLLQDNVWGPEPTVTGARVMTPQYASPEQIRGEPVTTAADVYSLGVVLYELLTGTRPYRLTDLPGYERERIICEREPTAPSTAVPREPELRRRLRGDLDTIILKALSKEPARRYATAQELADDLERHRTGKPVRARRDTAVYRATKFVRRNGLAVAAVSGVILALTAGTIVAAVGLQRARTGESAAVDARNRAEDLTRFMQEMLMGANPFVAGGDVTVYELLESASNRIEAEYAHQPELRAAVHYAVAQTYAGMWEWGRVIWHAEEAVLINQEQHGFVHESVADCMVLLGRAYTFLEDQRAVNVQREALGIRMKLLPDDDKAVAESRAMLGFALWNAARPAQYGAAERYYLDALARYAELEPEPSRDVGAIIYGLASMYAQQGRRQEAEARFVEAAGIFRRHHGHNDRYMIQCLQGYAALLETQARYGEAITLLEEVYAASPEGFAEQATAAVRWRIGEDRLLSGDHSGGRRDFHEILAAECDAQAAGHPREAARWRRLADGIRGAEQGLTGQEYLDLAGALYPLTTAGDGQIARRLSGLARLLRGDGALAEAATMLTRCLEAWPCQSDDPRVVGTIDRLVAVYDLMGDTRTADAWRARRPVTYIEMGR